MLKAPEGSVLIAIRYNPLRHADIDRTSLDHNDFAERVERIVGNVELAVSGKRDGVFLAVVAMLGCACVGAIDSAPFSAEIFVA